MTKQSFDPLRWIDQWVSKLKYRNLVFKGGGVRGIAYMGAMEVLEQLDLLSNIERIAGSSAMALAALLASFRMPVSQIL
jgi:NTE family protein